eukprot:11182210-Lingulodinium_polyedra.AAC.1
MTSRIFCAGGPLPALGTMGGIVEQRAHPPTPKLPRHWRATRATIIPGEMAANDTAWPASLW